MNPHFKQALDEGIIEPALFGETQLEVDGIKFYQYAQGGTTMKAHPFFVMADTNSDYDELRLDGATLDVGLDVIDDVLTQIISTTDKAERDAAIMTAKLHVVNIKQRRKYNMSIERILDNATFFCIAEDQNPARYDKSKAQRNKTLWMQHPDPGLFDFFLELMGKYGSLRTLYSSEGLNYLKNQLKMELSILKSSLDASARIGLTPDTNSTLKLRVETLNALIIFLTNRLKLISPTLLPTTPKPKNVPNRTKKRRK